MVGLQHKVRLRDGREVLLRTVQPDDAPRVVDHLNRLAQEGDYLVIDHSPHTPLEEELFIRTLSEDLYLYLLAESAGEMGGLLFVSRGTLRKMRHLATLALSVEPAYRGQGLGSALIREAIEWSRNHGVEKLFLSVISTNAEAIRLYERMGFRVEGVRPRHFKLAEGYADEVLMAQFLATEAPSP